MSLQVIVNFDFSECDKFMTIKLYSECDYEWSSAVDDKQFGEGLGNDEDGRGRLNGCLSPGAGYPCFATGPGLTNPKLFRKISTSRTTAQLRNSRNSSGDRDSERELSLRRHRTRTTKYNRLVHKFRHISTRLCVGTQVYQIQWNTVTQCNGHYANRHKWYIAKTRFFGLHFRCRKYIGVGLSSTTFVYSVPKATEFGEITLRLGLLRRSRSFKVTEFGTNRKLIYMRLPIND